MDLTDGMDVSEYRKKYHATVCNRDTIPRSSRPLPSQYSGYGKLNMSLGDPGLRRSSAATRLLGLRVRIPLRKINFVLCAKTKKQARTIKTKKQVRKRFKRVQEKDFRKKKSSSGNAC